MNLFLGMCKGVAGVPDDLRRLGYVDRWIEFTFTNSRNHAVVPELVIASNRLRHTILFEWKEGANTEANQLERYAGITAEDLRQKVFLTEHEWESHNTVIIGLEQHADRLVVAIDRDGHNFPVLVRCDRGMSKIRNRFAPDETDALFQPLLTFDWATIPTFLYPLDVDSSLSEYAELLMPAILERMGAGEARILLSNLAEAVIPVWANVDRAHQNRLRGKMMVVMERASRHELSQFLRRNRPAERRTHTPTWDVVDNPISNLGDRSAQGWKQMLQRGQSLIDSFRPGAHQPDLSLENGIPQ
jgi:hypothetical protein